MVTKLIGNALFGKEGFHVIHEIYSGLKPFRNSYTNPLLKLDAPYSTMCGRGGGRFENLWGWGLGCKLV